MLSQHFKNFTQRRLNFGLIFVGKALAARGGNSILRTGFNLTTFGSKRNWKLRIFVIRHSFGHCSDMDHEPIPDYSKLKRSWFQTISLWGWTPSEFGKKWFVLLALLICWVFPSVPFTNIKWPRRCSFFISQYHCCHCRPHIFTNFLVHINYSVEFAYFQRQLEAAVLSNLSPNFEENMDFQFVQRATADDECWRHLDQTNLFAFCKQSEKVKVRHILVNSNML